MKKIFLSAVMMVIAISASTATKDKLPTSTNKYPTSSWPKYPSWPTEPVCGWPTCKPQTMPPVF